MLMGMVLLSAGPTVRQSDCQSPRAANPERPTVATHAYVVAPGYAELEQGVRAFGVTDLGEGTGWDFNLKIGINRSLQVGFFGTAYVRNGLGSGVGDIGWAVKWRRAVGPKQGGAVALVPAVTVPTGDAALGRGAGRALGSLVAVYSADLAEAWHVDLNAGPTGIGAGKPQWFASTGASGAMGRWGWALELFDFTAGGAGPPQRGVLGATLITLAEWVVVDVGGVLGATRETPDQLFVGVTTNLGRIFK